MRQLTGLDAQFLAMETPRTYGHVAGLAVYDPSTAPGGKLERRDVCRLVGERLHLLPPFRWKLVTVPFELDHPYWIEDPHFDLDFHIRDSAVPPPGTPEQVAEVVARIVARPLDRAHPLWELYLIHGLEGGHVAMLTKMHHAAVDGVSGAEISSILLDPSPEGREVPPAPAGPTGERPPGQLEMLGRGLLNLPRQPVRAARSLPSILWNGTAIPGIELPGRRLAERVATDVRRAVTGSREGEILESTTVRAPVTRFNARISPHRRFAYDSLSLERIKALKDAVGVTVNDAVLALVASGLRTWLDEREELPEGPLVAMVPVSVRSREEMGTFGNRVSVMFVPIPTDEADPRRRLERVHEVMRVAKERHRALPADVLQDSTRFIPPAIAARAARVTAQLGAVERLRPLNLTMSNVPGPRAPLFCAGAKLVANFPVSVITDGAGLNVTCMSYMGNVDFGIVADRDQCDDAWSLMAAMRRGLDELDEAICGPPVTRPRPRARKAQAVS